MQKLDRIARWRLAVACACAGMVLALSQRALASDADAIAYAVTAPVSGYQVTAGSTIQVTWKGPGTSNVNIHVIHVATWTSFGAIASNTADDGEEFWSIPCDLRPGQYQIYVEDVAVTDWTYGTTFDILPCCPETSSSRVQEARPEVRIDRSRPMPRERLAPRP
ncbi:MAG TPA: GPI anchored serine-threonine rich family protein [Longimicrobium sp.]|jgi:hypothetical protein|uniref:GPI anchored serine-threonine rich family protein n=1 Tax=Longimicrobium sp. TaxID=2029185 RepID=UPI002ED950B3